MVALALVTMGLTASLGCSDDEGRPPYSSCFTGRTRVRTPSGDRRLEDLRVGDEVIACDPTTGELSVRKVVALIAHAPAETFALDAGDAHLEGVTKEHPTWVAARRAWVPVAELAVGDVLTVIERDGTEVDGPRNLGPTQPASRTLETRSPDFAREREIASRRASTTVAPDHPESIRAAAILSLL